MPSTVIRQQPINDTELEEVREELGVFLPAEYERFIQSSNGLAFNKLSLTFHLPGVSHFVFDAATLTGASISLSEKRLLKGIPHTLLPIMNSHNDGWLLMDIITGRIALLPHASSSLSLEAVPQMLYWVTVGASGNPLYFPQLLHDLEAKLNNCFLLLVYGLTSYS